MEGTEEGVERILAFLNDPDREFHLSQLMQISLAADNRRMIEHEKWRKKS